MSKKYSISVVLIYNRFVKDEKSFFEYLKIPLQNQRILQRQGTNRKYFC